MQLPEVERPLSRGRKGVEGRWAVVGWSGVKEGWHEEGGGAGPYPMPTLEDTGKMAITVLIRHTTAREEECGRRSGLP